MLKIWRGKNTLFAECTACGSYGTANHHKPAVRIDPDIAAALERHTAHMMALRSHYARSAGQIANQIRNGSLGRNDGTKKIRDLWDNHLAQVQLGEASLPSPDGKVKELAATCPWCGTAGEETEVEVLPDDVVEPPFSLARTVVPIQDPSKTAKGN
jgi:hypothetical protein